MKWVFNIFLQLIRLAPRSTSYNGHSFPHIFLGNLLPFCLTLSSTATGYPTFEEPKEESMDSTEKCNLLKCFFLFILHTLNALMKMQKSKNSSKELRIKKTSYLLLCIPSENY